jgi:hypothetical protein
MLIASKEQRRYSGLGRGAIHHNCPRLSGDVYNSSQIILRAACRMLREPATRGLGLNDLLDHFIFQAAIRFDNRAIAIANCRQLQAQAILQRMKSALFNDLSQQSAAYSTHAKQNNRQFPHHSLVMLPEKQP